MLKIAVAAFIIWARRRALHRVSLRRQPVVTFAGDFLFSRYEFLWRDEYPDVWFDRMKAKNPNLKRPQRLPWWRPINAFLHCWHPNDEGEAFHDHPRWSITICLRGQITERTPWSERLLTPGSIVFRSRKAIHAFKVAKEYRGKTWTIFIVGRRKHRQNQYSIKAQ